MSTQPFENAVRNAIKSYASSLGVTEQEAIELYKENQSTRDCIALLVAAQANPEKLSAFLNQKTA